MVMKKQYNKAESNTGEFTSDTHDTNIVNWLTLGTIVTMTDDHF